MWSLTGLLFYDTVLVKLNQLKRTGDKEPKTQIQRQGTKEKKSKTRPEH